MDSKKVAVSHTDIDKKQPEQLWVNPSVSPGNPIPGNADIYSYWMQVILPAVLSSLPLLLHRVVSDVQHLLSEGGQSFVNFIVPNSWRDSHLWDEMSIPVPEALLKRFDANGDGILSRDEFLNVTDWLRREIPRPQASAFWQWFAQEWPLMDWKVGVFLWRSFGGLLVLLTLCSIVPGRLHYLSARILRWPILGLTYFLVAVELVVYGIIRLIVRLAEFLIARPKHRTLRRKMQQATTYAEWYAYAAQLDISQKRHLWLRNLENDRDRYNWTFTKELIADLRAARKNGDALLGMAVLENCTRKNVGGVMAEDLFSYSNTGVPKYIVTEFFDEVTTTLHWLTDGAVKLPRVQSRQSFELGEEKIKSEARKEKDKLWRHLLSIFDQSSNDDDDKDDDKDNDDENESYGVINPSDYFYEKKQVAKQQVTKKHALTVNGSDSNGDDASVNSREARPNIESLPSVHRDQVVQLLRRARTAYGRTALCLSGGAMMGLYHCGHIRALLETGCLPHIISGTSAGSAIAAILCTRTEEELVADLRPEVIVKYMTCFSRPWMERIKSVYKTGCMFSTEEWESLLQWFTNGDLTFEEAYNRTGRVFCITLSSTSKKAPPVLLNHLTAPNVVIASAVVASGAVPGFIPPVRLRYKDSEGNIKYYGKKGESFFDGSIRSDIPISGLAEMFNVQFFIVCQVNPHIVPFFYGSKGKVGRPSRWSSGTQEHSWRGGFLLAALEMYLKSDMKAKFVFLDDLEAAVGFTSSLFSQSFVGSTTIVPQVSFWDYFRLFSDPKLEHLERYFQAGSIAVYEHIAMIKLHFRMADALDECLVKLSNGKVALQERASVNFSPLRPTVDVPPPIPEEDVPNVTPRAMKEDPALAVSSLGSFASDDDYEDEKNWKAL